MTIEVRLIQQTDVAIEIVNRLGQLTMSVVNATLAAGEYQYHINTSAWQNGKYYMQELSRRSIQMCTKIVKEEH